MVQLVGCIRLMKGELLMKIKIYLLLCIEFKTKYIVQPIIRETYLFLIVLISCLAASIIF